MARRGLREISLFPVLCVSHRGTCGDGTEYGHEAFSKCHSEAKHVLLGKVVCFNWAQNEAFIILSPVQHIVLAWKKTETEPYAERGEFRKFSSLSIQSVPRFLSFNGSKNVIAADRVKMGAAIPSPLHRVGAFKNLETNIALKLLLVPGRIARKCLHRRLEIEFGGLQNVFLRLVVHRCSFVLTGTRLPRIPWATADYAGLNLGVLLVISPRTEDFINADCLAGRCCGGHPKLASSAHLQLPLYLEFTPNWFFIRLYC